MSSILDYVYIAVFFSIFVFAVVLGYSIIFELNQEGIVSNDLFGEFAGFYLALQGVGIFILIGSMIGAIGASFMIKSHPIYLAITVFLIFIQAVVSPIMVNIINEAVLSDLFFSMSIIELDLLLTTLQFLPIITIVGSTVAALVSKFAD